MPKYKVHVYKLASKFEVPIEADNPEIAMAEALKIAKDPKRANEFKQHVEFLVLPFEVTEKPKKKSIVPATMCRVCYGLVAEEGEEYCKKHMHLKSSTLIEDNPDDYETPTHTD